MVSNSRSLTPEALSWMDCKERKVEASHPTALQGLWIWAMRLTDRDSTATATLLRSGCLPTLSHSGLTSNGGNSDYFVQGDCADRQRTCNAPNIRGRSPSLHHHQPFHTAGAFPVLLGMVFRLLTYFLQMEKIKVRQNETNEEGIKYMPEDGLPRSSSICQRGTEMYEMVKICRIQLRWASL